MRGAGLKTKSMSENRQIQADLIALAAMADSEIDLRDVPETTEFSNPRGGRYFPIAKRSYDIRSIANWCIGKARKDGQRIQTLWLIKLVYFIYEKALQDWHVLLSPARLEAWKHGPVFRELYFDDVLDKDASLYKKFDRDIRAMTTATDDFSVYDLHIFESVWSRYAKLSGSELRRISHAPGSPWDVVWSRAKHVGGFNLHIDVATILGQSDYWHGGQRK